MGGVMKAGHKVLYQFISQLPVHRSNEVSISQFRRICQTISVEETQNPRFHLEGVILKCCVGVPRPFLASRMSNDGGGRAKVGSQKGGPKGGY